MTSKEALDKLFDRANHDEYLFRSGREKALTFLEDNELFKETIKQDLERLETYGKANKTYRKMLEEKNTLIFKYEQENEKLKKVIKENFMYIPDALFEKVCFKWTGPVMEDEIIEVLNNET